MDMAAPPAAVSGWLIRIDHGGFSRLAAVTPRRSLTVMGSAIADAPGAEVVVERVSKHFGAYVRALKDVSLRVEPGEFVLLTGASGSGKSTLLNLIAGLDRPDGGRILVDGQSVAALADPARYRREVIGFVFQLHHLILGLTAEENVEMPLIPLGLRRSERLARVRAALADVGLGERGEHLPSQLSGGERQRVAIARALVGHPRLLLADEPTGALDSAAGEEILALLGALRDEHGMSVLLVSHQSGAAGYADRVIRLRDGRIHDEGIGRVASRVPRPDAAG
jgi:ABC-type lipoprotein export system ATPase subunit